MHVQENFLGYVELIEQFNNLLEYISSKNDAKNIQNHYEILLKIIDSKLEKLCALSQTLKIQENHLNELMDDFNLSELLLKIVIEIENYHTVADFTALSQIHSLQKRFCKLSNSENNSFAIGMLTKIKAASEITIESLLESYFTKFNALQQSNILQKLYIFLSYLPDPSWNVLQSYLKKEVVGKFINTVRKIRNKFTFLEVEKKNFWNFTS